MRDLLYKKLNTKHLLLVILFLTAFAERVAFDFGPNVELVTMSMILSSFYFGKKESFWLTFAIIATTDRLIGNSNIFLFTWSGFLIPALFSSKFIKILTSIASQAPLILKLRLKLLSLTSIGLASNLFFYLWTNFGVWLLGNMYSKNLQGLLLSYFYAIPFFKNQLVSTLIFVPIGFLIIEGAKKLLPVLSNLPAHLKLKKAFSN